MSAAAAAMLVAGVTVFVTASRSAGPMVARAATVHTIEILPGSFNPSYCQVNRGGDTVRWFNKDTKVRTIILPPVVIDNIYVVPRDPEVVQPGQYSISTFEFTSLATWNYHDADNPGITGSIVAPISPAAPAVCSPLPPTPTPTPTRTPMPLKQVPPACEGLMPVTRTKVDGCAIIPWVTLEGFEADPPLQRPAP